MLYVVGIVVALVLVVAVGAPGIQPALRLIFPATPINSSIIAHKSRGGNKIIKKKKKHTKSPNHEKRRNDNPLTQLPRRHLMNSPEKKRGEKKNRTCLQEDIKNRNKKIKYTRTFYHPSNSLCIFS